MKKELYSCRKNRGDVAKDISYILSKKNAKEISIVPLKTGIYVYVEVL